MTDPRAGHLRPPSRGRAKPPLTNPHICPVLGTPSRGRDGILPHGLLRPNRSPWFQWRGQREWLLAGDHCGWLALWRRKIFQRKDI